MDWIRRNWPDLLIGVALVAVIAMIIATLLSGGSLLSLVRRDTPPDSQATPQVTTPIGPQETAADGVDDGGVDDGIDSGEESAALSAPDGTETEASGDGVVGDAALTSDIDPFIPDAGSPQTGGGALLAADEDGEAGGATGADTATDTTTDTEVDTTAETGQAAPETAPAPASAAGRYRVAAGAIGTSEGADVLAQSYRDEGYPVEVEPQGDLFLLWVGPYESEADAESAAEGIRDAGGDALVYTFAEAGELVESIAEGDGAVLSGTPLDDLTEDDSADAASRTGDVSEDNTGTAEEGTEEGTTEIAAEVEPTAEAAATDGETAAAVPTGPAAGELGADTVVGAADRGASSTLPAAPAGRRYLQVGAFVNATSAEPLRTRLEQLDFDVTSSEADSGLTRLYVGPFGEAQLSQTQDDLTAQGIDSFPVAQ